MNKLNSFSRLRGMDKDTVKTRAKSRNAGVNAEHKSMGRPTINPMRRRRLTTVGLSPYHHYIIDEMARQMNYQPTRSNSGTADVIAHLLEELAKEKGISFEEFLARDDAEDYIKGVLN